jgi:hypothetical protein
MGRCAERHVGDPSKRSREALDRLDDLLGEKGHQFLGQHAWYVLELIAAHITFDRKGYAAWSTLALLREPRERKEYWLLPDLVRVLGDVDVEMDGHEEVMELAGRQNALYVEFDVGIHLPDRSSRRQITGATASGAHPADCWSFMLFALSGTVSPPRGIA